MVDFYFGLAVVVEAAGLLSEKLGAHIGAISHDLTREVIDQVSQAPDTARAF